MVFSSLFNLLMSLSRANSYLKRPSQSTMGFKCLRCMVCKIWSEIWWLWHDHHISDETFCISGFFSRTPPSWERIPEENTCFYIFNRKSFHKCVILSYYKLRKIESYFRIWKDIVMTLKTSHETNNSRDIFKRWVEGKICVESPRFQINRHMESWWWLVLRKIWVFPTLCHSKLLFIMPLAL